ncbi:MAG: hypothetical protein LBQ81_09780 [Zoogloeaceae bacterium]|nr:hypothetical protein [Zoogloeaceae bacterium]
MTNEVVELHPLQPAEIVEIGGELEIIEVALQGPPGPAAARWGGITGDLADQEDMMDELGVDIDLVALYQAAKL